MAAGCVGTGQCFLSLLELYETEITEDQMSERRVVKALEGIEHACERACPRVRCSFLAVRSMLSDLKTHSMAELSQTSPARLMLQAMHQFGVSVDHVMPHTARAVCAVTAHEALANLRAQQPAAEAASTNGQSGRGIEATR